VSTSDRDDEPDYDISDIVHDLWIDVHGCLRIGDADGDLPEVDEHGNVRYDQLDEPEDADEE
jgi:hypothetical protein